MSIRFPGDSPQYREARDRLLQQEIDLRRVTEAVAAERRALPPGGVVPEDYVFQAAGADGTPTDVRLSELFAPGTSSLVLYNFMRDYLGETPERAQTPMLNVFERDGDTIRHFWDSELFYAPTEPGQDPRHVSTLEPLWNLFDHTREGRPMDWDEQLAYR